MPRNPKVLVYDIETHPGTAWIWSLRDEVIPIDRLIEPPRIACWAAKWAGNGKIFFDDERSGRKTMLRGIHDLMSEADAWVTYNGERFDNQRLSGEFLYHRMPPLPPVASIDLWKTTNRLGYASSKLGFVGPHLKIGKKVEHEGFALWKACMAGDEKAWARMRRYNKQDVVLTEELYETVKPWIKNHPYMGVGGGQVWECPTCTSTRYQKRGQRRTRSFLIERLQCRDCGSWFNGGRVKAA